LVPRTAQGTICLHSLVDLTRPPAVGVASRRAKSLAGCRCGAGPWVRVGVLSHVHGRGQTGTERLARRAIEFSGRRVWSLGRTVTDRRRLAPMGGCRDVDTGFSRGTWQNRRAQSLVGPGSQGAHRGHGAKTSADS